MSTWRPLQLEGGKAGRVGGAPLRIGLAASIARFEQLNTLSAGAPEVYWKIALALAQSVQPQFVQQSSAASGDCVEP